VLEVRACERDLTRIFGGSVCNIIFWVAAEQTIRCAHEQDPACAAHGVFDWEVCMPVSLSLSLPLSHVCSLSVSVSISVPLSLPLSLSLSLSTRVCLSECERAHACAFQRVRVCACARVLVCICARVRLLACERVSKTPSKQTLVELTAETSICESWVCV